MTLNQLLEEYKVINTPQQSRLRIYINPSKEDLLELKDNLHAADIRYIAYAPNDMAHYLYVWDSDGGIHNEIAKQFGIDFRNLSIADYGYGEINPDGTLRLNIPPSKKWAWTKHWTEK